MLRVNGSEIFASGEVGYEAEGFTREQMVEALAVMDGDITLHLQSEGGDVFQGQSIYNQLRDYDRGEVLCIIDSLSASIATVIQCAADRVLAHNNSTVMVHNPFTIAIGDAREFRHTAEVLDKLTDDAAAIYAEKSGRTVAFWREIMDREKYFSAEQAKDVGIVDGIIDAEAEAIEAGITSASATQKEQRVVTAVASVVVDTPRLDAMTPQINYRRKMVDHFETTR